MNDNTKTYLTCRDIAKLLGVTNRHVLNVLTRKNISTEKDDSGKYIVQKSEFYRVFPKLMQEQDRKTEENDGNISMKVMEEKIRHLQEMLEEKKKQNDFLMEQISINDDKQSKMLDAISSHSRLLEYKESAVSAERKDKKFSLKKLLGKD